jgi:hypothetical protein
MPKIAHIVHPVVVDKSSDLVIAQPITFETMKNAYEAAGKNGGVNLFAVQYEDEERLPLPGCFSRLPDLTRSSRDIKAHNIRRKLAFINDILDALYNATDADYLIYTNVDIAVLPHFYLTVGKIIEQGYDGFIINRRTISNKYSEIEEIPLMYAEIGESHPGSDCFVFNRKLYKNFLLEDVIIGCAFIGLTLRTNIGVFSRQFEHFRDLHLTFHVGDDRVWTKFTDDAFHNKKQLDTIFPRLENNENVVNREMLAEMKWLFSGRSQQLLKQMKQ